MILKIPLKASVGLRVHKSDLFVRGFYEVTWPKLRVVLVVSLLLNIGLVTCLILK